MNVNQFKEGVENLSGETEVWVWNGKEVPREVVSMLVATSKSTGQSMIALFTEGALIADEFIMSLIKEEVKES